MKSILEKNLVFSTVHPIILKAAQDLHKHYRALFKSCTHVALDIYVRAYAHDHGWKACHQKEIFINRAKKIRALKGCV